MMTKPETYYQEDDGLIPNSPLPLLLYRGAFDDRVDPAHMENILSENNWRGLRRNGVFPYHQYHSTSHEVLACAALTNIRAVPLPETDPVWGAEGPLLETWRSSTAGGSKT